MNENLQKTIDESLKAVLDGLQAGVDFTKQQVPLLLQEKLSYDFYYYLFFTAFWLVLSIIAIVWADKWLQGARRCDDMDSKCGCVCTGFIPAAIVWFITLCALCNNIPALIQIHVAPRLYLMEWLVSLVKK